ncbi:MAG: hypothetical protein V5783_09930 [Pontiella sp.]
MNLQISNYMIPLLGAACLAGAALVVSGARTPATLEAPAPEDAAQARMPKELVLKSLIPTMEQVLAKHLFVPERVATGENAFPDLLVKGVYVGETERNAIFSLKSKPQANLRVWQGDEDAAMAQVLYPRDSRQPIVDFLGEWQIKSIDFSGVTVEHIFTGEVETYAVDYQPQKHVKASSQNGYGQGLLVEASAGTAKSTSVKPRSAQPAQVRKSSGNTSQIAGRVGQYMKNLSTQQRQKFMQQLQKQNAASKKQGNSSRQQGRNNSSNNRSKN